MTLAEAQEAYQAQLKTLRRHNYDEPHWPIHEWSVIAHQLRADLERYRADLEVAWLEQNLNK